VPCLPIETQFQGNTTIPEMISDTLPAVLVANNSFLVTGGYMTQAFDRLEVAEFSAKLLVIGAPLGRMVPINDAQVEDLRKKFLSYYNRMFLMQKDESKGSSFFYWWKVAGFLMDE
jgi:L-fuculose-phosphate aldolase